MSTSPDGRTASAPPGGGVIHDIGYRHYEGARPTLEDVLPVAEKIAAVTSWPGVKAFWESASLRDKTESAYVQRALAEDATAPWLFAPDASMIQVVCRPTLDLHTGVAGAHSTLHGSLRDDAERAFANAIVRAGEVEASIYFKSRELPPVKTLAEKHGDPAGQKIHPNVNSIAARWLDLALADQRRF